MDRFTVESTASDLGTLFRAERTDADGRLVDASRWTTPAQAIRDLASLKAGTYWVSDARRPYSTAA